MNIFQTIFKIAKKFFIVNNDNVENIDQNFIEEKKRRFNEYISLIFNPFQLIMVYVSYSLQDFKTQYLYSNKTKQNRKTFNKLVDGYANSIQDQIKKKIQGKIKKALLKALIKLIQVVIKFLPIILKFLLIILAIILIICIIWYIFSMFPSLSNLFSFSYGFDKTSYYDKDLFQSVKNKELMEENLYERTGETSYYQRFVDADIDDFARFILPSAFNNDNDSRSWSKKVEEAAKEFTGFYSLDSRLTLHDANLNGMSAFLQANTLSSKLEASADVQGYLRDYFNKETNFELSNQFLMQLNNKAFANYGDDLNKQLIYPEIFTKPVSYVYDFNRMELLREYNTNTKKYEYNWDEYTYVTQRALKSDIGKNIKDILTNYNELEWAKYYGQNVSDEAIKKEDEGKIISFPSPIIWEYIVKDKDDYRLFQSNPDSSPIVTNKYDSEYLLFKNDKTGQEFIPKFYYKIVSTKNGSFKTSEGYDVTTGSDPDNYIFDGPYMVLNNKEITNDNIDEIFDPSYKVKKVNNNGDEDENGLWFNIKIPDGYRLKDDVESIITDANGNEVSQKRTKDEIKVNVIYNTSPKKHLQLANLVGNDGDIAVSSQNLINYKYFKFKTISESYRNKQEYVDGWASYITDNKDFFTTYSDTSFWGALWNRVSSVGSIFNNVDTIEDDLDSSEDKDQAVFKLIKEYPEKALNLSLYLYEQEFKNNNKESNDTWKYDYSVNNYFRTDNDNFKDIKDYQKFFYVLEELKMSENNNNTPTQELINQALKEFPSIQDENGNISIGINELITNMTTNMTSLDSQTIKALQVISNKMSTRYLNLAQPKTVDVNGSNELIGEQVSLFSGNRIGEVSLESTLKYNSDLHKETISFSKPNGKSKDPESNFTFDFAYKTWADSISDYWDGLWGDKKDSSISQTVNVSAEEHSHLQDDYYIKENDLNSYSSNVFDGTEKGDELPLEIKSVRDYGLGSVLNYVDSVVVEYQSGMIYDESYLKNEIGTSIKNNYSNVYNDYNVKDSNEIGEGYFPKEMKDQGNDKLIELFAQNNKKELFKSLLESLDGKIISISNAYDEACKDSEKNGIIEGLGLSINDNLDNIQNLSVDGIFDGATGSGGAVATLSGNIGSNGFGNVSLSNISGDLYFNGNKDDTFKYYTPSLTNASSISQLVLPKRYYRSWLEKDQTQAETIKQWISLHLKSQDFIYKSDELPDLISVIAGAYKEKGINSNYMSSYNLSLNNKKTSGMISDYAKQLYNEEYNKKNFNESLNGSYEYIKENDLKKVYLIDEVVTFAGKFMYTYKDTLLTTTSSADENMPKSIIGSYATDRYVFLDSWDVKLLTDRIAKVDFMLFSVEGKINYNGDWIYISDYIDKMNDEKSDDLFGFMKHFNSTNNELQDTAKATYMFAVPSTYSNSYFESTGKQLNDIFNESTNDDGSVNKSQVFKELESYTQFIYNGFLFNESLNSSIFTTGGNTGSNIATYNLMNGNKTWKANDREIEEFKQYVKENAKYEISDVMGSTDFNSMEESLPSYEVHEFVNEKFGDDDYYNNLKVAIDNYLKDFSNNKFANYTVDDWINYVNSNYKDFNVKNVWASKNNVKSNIKKFFKNIDKDDFEPDEISNYIINELIAGSEYGYCEVHYHKLINGDPDSPGISYQDDLTSILSDLDNNTGNFILDIFGDIEAFLNKLAEKVLNLITGFEITSEDFNVKCVKFSNILIGSQFLNINENDLKSYFNKYVKVLDCQVKDFTNDDYFKFSYKLTTGDGSTENGTGRCYTNKKLVRYTLRVSDEIALDSENGRFYSQLSGFKSSSIGADISRTDLIEPTTNNYDKGELLYVKANTNVLDNGKSSANDFSSTLINSSEFLNIYNTKSGNTISMEDWNKIWSPQIKVFDNVNNLSYISDTMKEYVYGSIKNNTNTEGNIYKDKGSMNGKYVKEIKNPKDYFFFPSVRTLADYQFLNTLFPDNKSLKGYKIQTDLKHPLYLIDKNGIEHDNFTEKNESVNINVVQESIKPSNKIDLTAFTETLDYFYSDKVSELAQNTIKNSKSLGILKDEDKNNFHVTGFVLVPRIVDRRDEPTIYPLYRYWGGSKKKIEPSEKIKYFEGQTYDNWLNKMTVNENSTEEDLTFFKNEKNRLSEYLKSYLENFETYLPYNILSDNDLEVRGTAGYGDLMTNYTLTPEYTTDYYQLFENEANKSYWNDIIKKYDIDKKDIAQLLQGLAEMSIQSAAEDSLRLLRTGSTPTDSNTILNSRIISNQELNKEKPQYSQENIDKLNKAILATVNGASITTVELTTESGGKDTYYLPIIGLAAIDDLREISKDNDSQTNNDINNSIDYKDFAFVGNFSTNIKNISSQSTYLINKDATSLEILNNDDFKNIKDKKYIVVLLGANDIVSAISSNPDTADYRSVIMNLKQQNKDAKIYIVPYPGFANYDQYDVETKVNSFSNGLSPKQAGTSFDFESYQDLNTTLYKYNAKVKSALSNIDNIEYLDYTSNFESGLGGLNSNFVTNNIYFKDEYLVDLIKKEFENESQQDNLNLDKNIKSTKQISKNTKTTSYETDLKITKNSGISNKDDRLDAKKSVQYMGVRLYKMIDSTGDILKGIYSYYYGTSFLQSLVSVTADNAKNLLENPEHGLWYNPTEEDIKKALGENSLLLDNKETELLNAFGPTKMKNVFSFITNIDNRKKIVIGSTNSVQLTSNTELTQLYKDSFENYGKNADITIQRANSKVSGQSKLENKNIYGSISEIVIERCQYISNLLSPEDQEKIILDPALFIAAFMQESSLNPNASNGGLCQINGNKSTSIETNNGTINFDFNLSEANDPVASIEYTICDYISAYQKYFKDSNYKIAPIMLFKGHNAGYGNIAKTRKNYSEYDFSTSGDVNYVLAYENPKASEYSKGYDILSSIYGPNALNYGYTLSVYVSEMQARAKLGSYGDPLYVTHMMNYYIEDYSSGGTVSASSSRDYIDELWESQYLKYQNTGVKLVVNHMFTNDIDDLINMTANYRNNNEEQSDYGYTYLDFFKNINKKDETNHYEFSGQQDALILNSMRYLGAHYSQGRSKDVTKVGKVVSRFANHDNLTSSGSATAKYTFTKFPYGKGFYYTEGTNYYTSVPNLYGMDCSSFASMMYIAMGYEFPASTTATLRNAFTKYPGNCVTTEVNYDSNNLKTGDILITTTHAMLWIGDYSNNYKDLFNEDSLLCNDPTLYWTTGKEALKWANENVSGKSNVIIHEGGSFNNHSFVNIKERPNVLKQGDCKVFRIFNENVEYSKSALESAGMLCPTIFSKTTIKNNPYLVEYMENSGILEQELANGMFTMEDVQNAKNAIEKSKK